jgi:hypothetical protein
MSHRGVHCNGSSGTARGKSLALARLAEAKRLPVDFLQKLGLHDLRGSGVGITYIDAAGNEIAVKRRTALKATDGSFWPKGQPLAAYGDWRLDLARREGLLFLVEGESDCWALWYHRLPALGIPGADGAKVLTAEHLECIETIYVHREPDQGGERFVRGIQARLRELRFVGKAFELRCPNGIKDPADLHAADPEKFRDSLRAAIEASTPLEVVTARTGRQGSDPPPWETPIPLSEPPPVDAFPVLIFPRQLITFAEDVAQALSCPIDYVAVPMLVMAGAAIGASRALEVKAGWRERPCLYAAVIGPPGSAKTPALSAVAAPMYAEQSRRLTAYRDKKTQWDDNGQHGAPPELESAFVSDVTTEKLASVLQRNPRGVALIRDELTGWVAGMDQYKAKGKGGDRQFYLSAWAGAPVRIDRKSQDEPVIVPHPFVSVIGGLPPDLLNRLRGEKAIADGFFDRILFTYPKPFPAVAESWACVSDEAAQIWANTLSYLWILKPERDNDGLDRPHFVRLDSSGREAWVQFTRDLAAEMNRDELPDAIKGHLAKFKGYCARLALILHCLRLACGDAKDEDVDGDSMARAAGLIDYFRGNCLKVHAALGSDRKAADAGRLLKWAQDQKGGQFSRRDAYRAMRSRVENVDALEPILDLLVKHGYCRPLDVSRSGPGRKPSEVYEVNPLDSGQNGQNGQNTDPEADSVHSVHSVHCPGDEED